MNIWKVLYTDDVKSLILQDPRLSELIKDGSTECDDAVIVTDCEYNENKPFGDFMLLLLEALLMSDSLKQKFDERYKGDWRSCNYISGEKYHLYYPPIVKGVVDEKLSKFTFVADILVGTEQLNNCTPAQFEEARKMMFTCDYLVIKRNSLPPLFFLEQKFPIHLLCTDDFRQLALGCTGIEFSRIGST